MPPLINPWKSYRQTATLTAPPGQVVMMLFDGAVRFLDSGLDGFGEADPGLSNMAIHNNLERAREIIRQLNLALDTERGGDLACELRRLYDYFDRRLLESNVKKKPQAAQEVRRHLAQLRDAWSTMLKAGGEAQPVMAELAAV